jgi:hypothetical protein
LDDDFCFGVYIVNLSMDGILYNYRSISLPNAAYLRLLLVDVVSTRAWTNILFYFYFPLHTMIQPSGKSILASR